MSECVVCYNKDNLIKTSCCAQFIHQRCLNKWLHKSSSKGKCPFCRAQLRSLKGVPETDFYIQSRWNDPIGYIDISTGSGHCNVSTTLENHNHTIPNTYLCSYENMENSVTDNQIRDGYVIILTNDEGNYFDTINLTPGWILRVNQQEEAMQLSSWLRME